MKEVIIAVCDTDGAYCQRLGEYISLENQGKILGVSFSSPESFGEYLKRQRPDIVLLGGGFTESSLVREALIRQIEMEQEGAKKGRLQDEPLWLYLNGSETDSVTFSEVREIPWVAKYQPVSRLLREVFSHYQGWNAREHIHTGGQKEIIGIYSPGHSIWQTPFALTFAQALGQQEKVLYVNLKECAGFSGWFQEEYEKDLLDVMYLCLANEVNVFDCVNSARYTMEGIDYIPPAEDGGCLAEISSQDYVAFIKLLSGKSGYDVILLDFGMMIPGFYRLLGTCSQVYIATEAGEIQEGPLQQFRQMTARQEDMQLEQKFIYLSLPPVNPEICTGSVKLQQWLWGVMGDFSRRLAGVQCGAD